MSVETARGGSTGSEDEEPRTIRISSLMKRRNFHRLKPPCHVIAPMPTPMKTTHGR
jgi:hypothetical protein